MHKRFRTLFSVVALVALSSPLVGCYPVRSKSDAIGHYELNVERDGIALDVSTDSTFTETIRWASGKVEKRAGKWIWGKGRIGFEGLWIPKSFAPDYIIQADSEGDGNQPKYIEPGYWSMSLENHWGTITIPVF